MEGGLFFSGFLDAIAFDTLRSMGNIAAEYEVANNYVHWQQGNENIFRKNGHNW